jgi:hypothetical protein
VIVSPWAGWSANSVPANNPSPTLPVSARASSAAHTELKMCWATWVMCQPSGSVPNRAKLPAQMDQLSGRYTARPTGLKKLSTSSQVLGRT